MHLQELRPSLAEHPHPVTNEASERSAGLCQAVNCPDQKIVPILTSLPLRRDVLPGGVRYAGGADDRVSGDVRRRVALVHQAPPEGERHRQDRPRHRTRPTEQGRCDGSIFEPSRSLEACLLASVK